MSQSYQFNKNDLIRWLMTAAESFAAAALITLLNMLQNQTPIDRKVVATAGVTALLNLIRRWAFNNQITLVPSVDLKK